MTEMGDGEYLLWGGKRTVQMGYHWCVVLEGHVNLWAKLGIGAITIIGAAVVAGLAGQRSAMAEAEKAFAAIAQGTSPTNKQFSLDQLTGLPEIAQRYFQHAIAPGTPIYSTAELTMKGSFLLGDKGEFQTYRMIARQVLRAPDQFVWMPSLTSAPMFLIGSDALFEGSAWTRFWLLGLIPVTNEQTTPDLLRSAQFRAAVESAIWLPTSLLPGNDVDWKQLGPNTAHLTFNRFDPAIEVMLTLDGTGAVKEVVGQRWSNANQQKAFRLQPFGGTMLEESTFAGLTVPTKMAIGNHYGTADYLPFFQASIDSIRYR